MFKPGDKVRPIRELYDIDSTGWCGFYEIPFAVYTVDKADGFSDNFSIKEYPDKGIVWSFSYWEKVPKEENIKKILQYYETESNLENTNQ